MPKVGTVFFAPGETCQSISVDVVDDDVPELSEMFEVHLTKPVGGAILGKRKSIDIHIDESDYPYGLFK